MILDQAPARRPRQHTLPRAPHPHLSHKWGSFLDINHRFGGVYFCPCSLLRVICNLCAMKLHVDAIGRADPNRSTFANHVLRSRCAGREYDGTSPRSTRFNGDRKFLGCRIQPLRGATCDFCATCDLLDVETGFMYKKISFRSVPKPGPGNRAGLFIARTRLKSRYAANAVPVSSGGMRRKRARATSGCGWSA